MSAIGVGLIAWACLFGGSLIGMRVRNALPEHHLNEDSKKLLQLGLGIIGTMAGLLLGLLVASATAAYNEQRNELLNASSTIVLLDRVLAHYGPEANEPRRLLKATVQSSVDRIWSKGPVTTRFDPASRGPEAFFDELENLSPKTESQRSLKPEALSLLLNLFQTRWLLFEQTGATVSVPLLIVLVFWFTITFTGFGIFAPPNPTVMVSLAICALAVSGAIFLILEMYSPFSGIMQLSSQPLRYALAHLGQ
jgi:hypothetical protein